MDREKIRVAICGYGNLGKGVEKALMNPANRDMELVAIFSRRDPSTIHPISGVKVISVDDAYLHEGNIDVVILCGGSATDLPVQGPMFAKLFNTVDSFDTHAKIPEYYNMMEVAAGEGEHISIISVGWDPGMFSLNRIYAEAILPTGNTYTFWGKGVSQGHSDAIRRIAGVKNAVQYTIPVESSMEKVRNGENPELTTRQKHLRDCYVVAEDDADRAAIEKAIKEMPNYFSDYDTTVHFISENELKEKHSKMSHGGFVIRSGETGINSGNKQVIEYSLKLESNPEFTGSVLVAYARAAAKMSCDDKYIGAYTVLDIAPEMLSPKTYEELLAMI